MIHQPEFKIEHVYDNAAGQTCPSCSGAATGQPAKTIYPTFTREFAYDKRGRKILEKDVISGTEYASQQFEYDEAGNLVFKIDKEGRKTAYAYDALNRLTVVKDDREQETRYAYDSRGGPRGTSFTSLHLKLILQLAKKPWGRTINKGTDLFFSVLEKHQ
ncbi:MAG: hypothetical protein JW943_12020 [Deltaproteobacteria bacterium]|nr:hypothetical protein [Deltaproteobacteria bacterium]